MHPSKTTPPGPGRGRKPGSGAAQQRILDVLRQVDPMSLRAAELAARAKVNHHSLAKCTGALLELGQITRCLVQPAKGNKTFEFRIGAGIPPNLAPLNPKRAGIAGTHRSSAGPLPPIPKTTPAPVVPKATTKLPTAAGDDAVLLRRIQTMSEPQFRDYINHLARVWSWGRAQGITTHAMHEAA